MNGLKFWLLIALSIAAFAVIGNVAPEEDGDEWEQPGDIGGNAPERIVEW